MTALRLRATDLAVVRCANRSRAAWYALVDSLKTFGGSRAAAPRLRPGEFHALDGIDLELRAGEAIAVIGENGAGKSTLLKALAGTLQTSRGEIARHGTVGAVIELGEGLNPLLTGRENIELGALLKGLRDDEALAYANRVSEFADLAEAIDAPLESYSSGMVARLSFAAAAMARPDVLLIDEALSVGDPAFQRKCVRFIDDFLARGGSILIASHNLVQVQMLCSQAIMLVSGKPAFAGSATEAVRALVERNRPCDRPVEAEATSLRLVRFGDEAGKAVTGKAAVLEVDYTLDHHVDDVCWGFEIWTADQLQCVTTAQDMRGRELAAGSGTLRCRVDRLPLAPGTYAIRLNIIDRRSGTPVALAGFAGAASCIVVESPPSIASNYQVEVGQLAVVEVSWT